MREVTGKIRADADARDVEIRMSIHLAEVDCLLAAIGDDLGGGNRIGWDAERPREVVRGAHGQNAKWEPCLHEQRGSPVERLIAAADHDAMTATSRGKRATLTECAEIEIHIRDFDTGFGEAPQAGCQVGASTLASIHEHERPHGRSTFAEPTAI
jgi:hypothetical protein